ncbi:MAG: hypothetical protein HFG49_01580 [Lachnospiraceae bacterium]|jgi:cell division septum initiation protein DivIVA|nr:hypothetical protein [Lachnospiraceae bacterium]
MSVEHKLQILLEENKQLKKDNETMHKTIAQMNLTLARMIKRYVTYSEHSSK